MTRIVNGMLFIEPEEDGKCELCGKIDELRPYGPNGERICFECGMKDEDSVNKQIQKLFDQLTPQHPESN
jgi:hypothetical protein